MLERTAREEFHARVFEVVRATSTVITGRRSRSKTCQQNIAERLGAGLEQQRGPDLDDRLVQRAAAEDVLPDWMPKTTHIAEVAGLVDEIVEGGPEQGRVARFEHPYRPGSEAAAVLNRPGGCLPWRSRRRRQFASTTGDFRGWEAHDAPARLKVAENPVVGSGRGHLEVEDIGDDVERPVAGEVVAATRC